MRQVLFVLIATSFHSVAADAGALADVEIYDRTAQRLLAISEHEGRLYVVGEPRHRYEMRVRSRTGVRLLAVASVDGVNVVNGKTAAPHQSGYVLEPWGGASIEGWRKNLDEVATFYFTRLPDSYAARTGRPENVGVIGVAIYPERRPCCREWLDKSVPEAAGSADAPPAGAGQELERGGDSRLGTGHGHREASPAQYVDFRRASATPDETIVIYYDSRKNLIAQGVFGETRHYARRPAPFPGEFAPDPDPVVP
jgi:hypothetical protein